MDMDNNCTTTNTGSQVTFGTITMNHIKPQIVPQGVGGRHSTGSGKLPCFAPPMEKLIDHISQHNEEERTLTPQLKVSTNW